MTTWQYLKQHGYFTDKTSPEGFRFNKNGVCKNPERIDIYHSKKQSIAINICCCNGAWDYGYEFKVNYGSYSGSYGPCGHPAPSRDTQKRFADRPIYNCKFYATRDEAITAALDHAQEFLDRANKYHPGHGIRKAYAAIQQARAPQLTLF